MGNLNPPLKFGPLLMHMKTSHLQLRILFCFQLQSNSHIPTSNQLLFFLPLLHMNPTYQRFFTHPPPSSPLVSSPSLSSSSNNARARTVAKLRRWDAAGPRGAAVRPPSRRSGLRPPWAWASEQGAANRRRQTSTPYPHRCGPHVPATRSGTICSLPQMHLSLSLPRWDQRSWTS
jgi:hypothetical protein